MEKIKVELLEGGRIKVTITSMPGTANHYNLLIRYGGICDFENNVFGESAYNAKRYFDNDNHGRIHWHISLSQEENSQYSVIFEDTKWVKHNIGDFISQLKNQAQQIKINLETSKYIKSVAQAVKTGDYKSLIQQMIVNYADKLSDIDVMEIQRTLTDVKDEKGLTSRPSTKFGI